jgi:hypothetical protein
MFIYEYFYVNCTFKYFNALWNALLGQRTVSELVLNREIIKRVKFVNELDTSTVHFYYV